MAFDKAAILALIIRQLRSDLAACEQAVAIARDTATHKDTLGSSRYETMGLEASYLAQGQGVRLVEVERALAWFTQLRLTEHPETGIALSSLVRLMDENGGVQYLWLAADAGGMKVESGGHDITVITPKSPLGKALIGRQQGECFEVRINGKTREYAIEAVE